MDSDNHECPECQEIDVSPDTLIPNRYLRRAVMNFKNQTGYTRVKKASFIKSPPIAAGSVSPQPSPDSTVESQPQQVEKCDKSSVSDIKIKSEDPLPEELHKDVPADVKEISQTVTSPKPSLDEE